MKRALFCLLLALAFLLSACGAAVKEEESETERQRHRAGESAAAAEVTAEPAAPAPEETPEPAPELTPEPTPAPDPVVTANQWAGDYSDGVGNHYHYFYRIPAFSSASDDAQAMNQRVYDFVMARIGNDLAIIEGDDGFSLVCYLADYEVYQNGDLISVVSTVSNDWGQDEYCVLNLDAWTQREAGRELVLAAAGLNETSFLERAREAAGKTFGDPSGFPEEMMQFAEDQYHKTVMDENLQDTQLFLNEAGRLCMVVRIFSMAGADYYWRIVEL